jgi:hypothetical protein
MLVLLMRTANRPLKSELDLASIDAVLEHTQPPPPLAEVPSPPSSSGSDASESEAYNAAWQEEDGLSDWESDGEASGVRFEEPCLRALAAPSWSIEHCKAYPPGTPGLARASVAAAQATQSAIAPSTPVLAYPTLPLPYVRTEPFVHDKAQPGDLAYIAYGEDSLTRPQAPLCYQESAVAQQALQLLLVRSWRLAACLLLCCISPYAPLQIKHAFEA